MEEITEILERNKLSIQDIEKNILDNVEIIITNKGLAIKRRRDNYTELITFPIFDIETDNYMAQVE